MCKRNHVTDSLRELLTNELKNCYSPLKLLSHQLKYLEEPVYGEESPEVHRHVLCCSLHYPPSTVAWARADATVKPSISCLPVSRMSLSQG